MRKDTRHSTSIPIQVSIADSDKQASRPMVNLCVGGLCCEAKKEIPIGTHLDILIPGTHPLYQGKGVVAWCQQINDERYVLGVHFKHNDQAFRTRMVEQICQIERYKELILQTEGRNLSSENAAREWIDKFADTFVSRGR